MSPGRPAPTREERDRLDTLERAAERHERQGSPLKAIADCKRILLIDPDHPGIRERIDALCEQLYGGTARPVGHQAVSLEPHQPLEEIVLEDALVETPSVALDDDLTAQPMVEIELDWKSTKGDEARRIAASTLPRTRLFAGLDGQSLRDLVDGARLVELPAEHELFHQGDPGDALYVIVEGAVVPIAEGEVRKKLAVLEEGDFFGEGALVTERPRSATIEALVDTKLLAIDRALVARLVERQPVVLQVLLRYVRDRLMSRLLHTSPLYTALPGGEREAVAERFRMVEIADGAILVRQGQPSSGLYVLMAGRVRVIHFDGVGDKQLATLGPGDVFGEMSMVQDDEAMASCVSSGKCWALALARNDFRALAEADPAVREVVEELAEARRRQNEDSLVSAPYLDAQLDLV